ncbi:hypothetical protein ACFFG2_09640 [Paraburkholderia solisilvae]
MVSYRLVLGDVRWRASAMGASSARRISEKLDAIGATMNLRIDPRIGPRDASPRAASARRRRLCFRERDIERSLSARFVRQRAFGVAPRGINRVRLASDGRVRVESVLFSF